MPLVKNLLSQRTYLQGFTQGFFLASVGVTIGFTLGVLTLFQCLSFRGQPKLCSTEEQPRKHRNKRNSTKSTVESQQSLTAILTPPTERQRLKGKVVVVTGGGAGIGRAICELFAAEGANVVVVDVNLERAQETVIALQQRYTNEPSSSSSNLRKLFIAIKADVSEETQVEGMVRTILQHYANEQRRGPVIHVLVNNAAISIGDDVLDPVLDSTAWDQNLRVVLKSQFLCSRALLPYMMTNPPNEKRDESREEQQQQEEENSNSEERETTAIINITSVNGMTALGGSAYSAAKAGVINLTKNMAIKYGCKGVRVNSISPGTIRDTRIFDSRLQSIADRIAKEDNESMSPTAIREEAEEEFFGQLAAWYPMGRVGRSMDVARAALFLSLHSESSWITGTNLVVDGGLTAGLYRMAKELEQS
eukprot:TRINITY_DN1993_c0_g1_i1.p1 TRINITY_DN1993_c0_g1~~TRINITY_DN1993_c0_g1_i1.p1  ORF type:complete len:420 (-),score=117.08 TRINITY_DN1993_c0_g1_i1:139-1398(-)